ncbi:hypothetical protein EV421DRAFT_1744191 [Armillaria borealis]|uniref:Restriction endonuclease domain-containing protein n=1 Tax=Armillaria borealis TaxID=47425 RepID=A0AA39ITS2_9AGAR|nr:hypothetical protein EV421DRAFT_1744191 [Armillaria borealis]
MESQRKSITPEIAEDCPPSPIPEDIQHWLKGLEDFPPGSIQQKELNDLDSRWVRDNWDEFTEAHRGRWEFLGDKIIVTLPTPCHQAIQSCVQAALNKIESGRPWFLEHGTSTPLRKGHIKQPFVLVFDRGNNYTGRNELPLQYEFPHIIVEVGHSEAREKVIRDILRLLLELEGVITLGIGCSVLLNEEKKLKGVEILIFYLSDKGTLSLNDARPFTVEEIYAHRDDKWTPIEGNKDATNGADTFRLVGPQKGDRQVFYECSSVPSWTIDEEHQSKKEDIVIPERFLKRIPDGTSAVISAKDLWCHMKKRHEAQALYDIMLNNFKNKGESGMKWETLSFKRGKMDSSMVHWQGSDSLPRKKARTHEARTDSDE